MCFFFGFLFYVLFIFFFPFPVSLANYKCTVEYHSEAESNCQSHPFRPCVLACPPIQEADSQRLQLSALALLVRSVVSHVIGHTLTVLHI